MDQHIANAAEADSLFGLGVYTAPEAARLLKVRSRAVRRWVSGYRYGRRDRQKQAPPLFERDWQEFKDDLYLSFRDLMELRVVAALIRNGIGLQTARAAIVTASSLFDNPRPLSTEQFRTDGRRVFFELPEHEILDLATKQYVFSRVVEPSFKGTELSDRGPLRWWPLGHGRSIVIDPRRCFGAPIDDASGVPVETLLDAIAAEGSIRRAAAAYGVAESALRDARDYAVQFSGIAVH